MHKSMDEFAAGMREAAAKVTNTLGFAATARSIREGNDREAEACVAYVREQFEFVEVFPNVAPKITGRRRYARYMANGAPSGYYDEGGGVTHILIPKPAPEPPDVNGAARELVDALEAEQYWPHNTARTYSALNLLRTALKESDDE